MSAGAIQVEESFDIEFSYEPAPGVEITILPAEEGWRRWEKSHPLLDRAVRVAKRRGVLPPKVQTT